MITFCHPKGNSWLAGEPMSVKNIKSGLLIECSSHVAGLILPI